MTEPRKPKRGDFFPPWANLLDWAKVLTDAEEADIEWLAFPFIEAGTVSSVYCDPKDGKSLVMQMICKQIALGQQVLSSPAALPRPVLYLDYENPDSIIGERFLDMGAAAGELEKYLIYSSFPAIKPLDTPEGGQMLCEMVNATGRAYGQPPALTVIDTLSKTFAGAESSADTFSDLYRYSLLPLRRAKMTVLYLDHSGKDPTAGQRGSSAKPSDVDVVWRLSSRKGPRDLIEVVKLEPTHSRAAHVEAFTAAVAQEPLRIEMSRPPVSDRALELAKILQDHQVPPHASRAQCRAALTNLGIPAKTSDLAEAVKYRKAGDNRGDSSSGTTTGTVWGQRGQTASDLGGQPGDRNQQGTGTMSPSFRRGQWPAPGAAYDSFTDVSYWGKMFAAADHGKVNRP